MTDVIQRSFSGGELAPSLWARSDQSKYATGLRTCRNFVVHKHGGVSNRAGTEFDVEVKDSTKAAIVLPFKFSNAQRYAMEFGEYYIRFHQSGGQIVVTGTDAPAYSGATAYAIGDLCTSVGVRYYCIAATTGNAPPNATYWYALVGDVYEIPTSYAEADLTGLRITQSADVVTIVHPSYDSMELSRYGNVTWVLSTIVFAPSITPPTGGAAALGVAGPPNIVWRYKLASIDADTGEESEPSAMFSCIGNYPTFTAPNVITWAAVAAAGSYEVYKEITPGNGVYGIIGVAVGTTFNDINIIASAGEQPVVNKTPFAGAGNKPSVVLNYQQRRWFAATDNSPEKTFATKIGQLSNLSISSPLQDDDAMEFTIVGDTVNRVTGLVGLRRLVILTESSEHIADGVNGSLTPTGGPNPTEQGYNGATNITPIKIGNEALYVQARGGTIRNIGYDLQSDGYKGDDITLFATHLFKGRTVVSWAYAQVPDSTVWVVMDDGALLGLTYIKSQQVWGWHRHDTKNGLVESVCVIPEGDEDRLYMVVKRVINGVTVRYVERMASRTVIDLISDAFFVDSGLSYDGTNYDLSNTITLTGGTLWDNEETLTATAAVGSTFVAGDVGNRIVMTVNGVTIKLDILAFNTDTDVDVRCVTNVPVEFQATPIVTWSKAVDALAGLGHLEGEALSILGDGAVIANGVDTPLYVVSGGGIASLGGWYSIIHAGLPIEADFETLSIDTADERTLLNKESLVTEIDLMVESSRGIWAGPDADHLTELKQRSTEDYGELIIPATGLVRIGSDSTYDFGGRVFVRQRDPLPLTILAAIPVGLLGGV